MYTDIDICIRTYVCKYIYTYTYTYKYAYNIHIHIHEVVMCCPCLFPSMSEMTIQRVI